MLTEEQASAGTTGVLACKLDFSKARDTSSANIQALTLGLPVDELINFDSAFYLTFRSRSAKARPHTSGLVRTIADC